MPTPRSLSGVLPKLAAAAVLALSLQAVPAAAQDNDDAVLPRAQTDKWTSERLRKSEAPFVDGAIAQIAGEGEGRFAVICKMNDNRGEIAYRSPPGSRQALRDAGREISVNFIFENGDKIPRKLTWDAEGRYWTGAFGAESKLAAAMKKYYKVRVNVLGQKDVDSSFTLTGSWRSIEAMFAMCKV